MIKSLTFAGAALLTVFILPLGASAKDQSPDVAGILVHAVLDNVYGNHQIDHRNHDRRWDDSRDRQHARNDRRGDRNNYRHSPNYQRNGYSDLRYDGRRYNRRDRDRRSLAYALTDIIKYSLNDSNRGGRYGRHQYSVHVDPSSIKLGKRVNTRNNRHHYVGYGARQQECRKFKGKVRIDGHREKAKGIACRGRNGSWEIVDLKY